MDWNYQELQPKRAPDSGAKTDHNQMNSPAVAADMEWNGKMSEDYENTHQGEREREIFNK